MLAWISQSKRWTKIKCNKTTKFFIFIRVWCVCVRVTTLFSPSFPVSHFIPNRYILFYFNVYNQMMMINATSHPYCVCSRVVCERWDYIYKICRWGLIENNIYWFVRVCAFGSLNRWKNDVKLKNGFDRCPVKCLDAFLSVKNRCIIRRWYSFVKPADISLYPLYTLFNSYSAIKYNKEYITFLFIEIYDYCLFLPILIWWLPSFWCWIYSLLLNCILTMWIHIITRTWLI